VPGGTKGIFPSNAVAFTDSERLVGYPEAMICSLITSRLPVIWELSSGCFQVKSAPQFSRSGYHDLDAQKIQALAVKKPCQRSASLLLCDRKL
jgi:hypothetical protein